MEELAVMVSEQHGKTIADAKGSIQRVIEVVEYATGITDSLKGDHSTSVGTISSSQNVLISFCSFSLFIQIIPKIKYQGRSNISLFIKRLRLFVGGAFFLMY